MLLTGSRKEVKNRAKHKLLEVWQRQWDEESNRRRYYRIQGKNGGNEVYRERQEGGGGNHTRETQHGWTVVRTDSGTCPSALQEI